MSYSSNNFLKPIGSDKNIRFFDNEGNLTFTLKPTFIIDVTPDANLLKVTLKSGKLILLDFINFDDVILAQSKLKQQISILLQTNNYVDNSTQGVVGYVTAPFSYSTFLRPITESDRNIKIMGVDLVVKFTIEPFSIVNSSVSNNLLKINLKSNKSVTLEFSTSNESKLALIRLKEQIDILTEKIPLIIDKNIENYIDSKIFSGPTGPQGPTGSQGPIGPIGASGPQGIQGSQGIQGIQGPQGIQGATGPQGLQGSQGPQGIQGFQGPEGPQGPTGSQGIQGSQGPQGSAGSQGPQGPQGPTGPQGTQGPQGSAGFGIQFEGQLSSTASLPQPSVQGYSYLIDNQLWVYDSFGNWVNGGQIQGPQGIQGIQGEQGPQGIRGATGPQGIQGTQGPQGNEGPQGPQGIRGATGPQGPQGIQGPQGNEGPQGPQGIQGPTGPQGIPGVSTGSPYYFNLSYGQFSKNSLNYGEVNNSTYVNANSSSYFSYYSPSGEPGVPVISAGIWKFYLHLGAYDANNSSLAPDWNIYCKVFKNNNNSNNLLFTTDPLNITDMPIWYNPKMYVTDGFFPNTTLNINDTLVVEVVFENLNDFPSVATFYSQGSAHYSYAITSLAVAGIVGPQGPQGPQGLQGIQGLKGDQGIQGIQGIKGPTGSGYYGTSTTEFSIPEVGAMVEIETQPNLGFTTDQWIIISSNMEFGESEYYDEFDSPMFYALVDDYNSETGILNVVTEYSISSGTFSQWYINLSGERGLQGATGATGAGYYGTSTTEFSIPAPGFIRLIQTQPDLGFTSEQWVVVTSDNNYGEGEYYEEFESPMFYALVDSYNKETGLLNIVSKYSKSTGSTFSQWYINLIGAKGLDGATGSGGSGGGSASSIFWEKGTTTDATDKIKGIYRLGSLLIGSASIDSNDRFIVSTTGGTLSLVVDNSGSIYNGFTSDLRFGYNALTNIGIFGLSDYYDISNGSGYTDGTYSIVTSFVSGPTTLTEYPVIYVIVSGGMAYIDNVISTGRGWIDDGYSTVLTAAIPGGSGYQLTISVYPLNNTAIGNLALYSNTIGGDNTAVGYQSLYLNTTGGSNTSIGFYTLFNNTTGYYNTAIGAYSLYWNTGSSNTAIGTQALSQNTTGYNNTAIGVYSLNNNTTGYLNTAIGSQALYSNTNGNSNVAIGNLALTSNTTGYNNTTIGNYSLYLNTTGYFNTALGYQALYTNKTGYNNTSLGYSAGQYISTGFDNNNSDSSIFIGDYTKPYLDNQTNQIVIGSRAVGNGSNTVTLGNDSIIKTYLKGSIVIVDGTGNESTGIGYNTLNSNTGYQNTALGYYSLYSNTTGPQNTALGFSSLRFNTTGSSNTAVGVYTLYYNTTGYDNTTLGLRTLQSNTTGFNNIAIGNYSLYSNITGYYNTAIGSQALNSNTTGYYNTAIGSNSLYSNTTGYYNTAIGLSSLYQNTTGYENVAIGISLYNNTTGYQNTAIGNYSLYYNTTGYQNTAIGNYSLYFNTTTVNSLSTIVGGSGYVPGTYSVTLIRATGSTALSYPSGVTVTVGATGSVTSVTLGSNLGFGFKDTTTVLTTSAANLGGTGSGFTVNVGSIVNGYSNTAIGYQALYSNTNGNSNVAIGYQASLGNTVGYSNIAIGYQAISTATSSIQNIAIGYQTLNRTSGSSNIAIGYQASYLNTTGANSVAIGYYTLNNNTTGDQNTSVGAYSLRYNTTGSYNTALGIFAINTSTSSSYNTAIGYSAISAQAGSNNTAIGAFALSQTLGSNNTALGYNAGRYYTNGIPATASTNSIFIGYDTRPSTTNNTNEIVIGYGVTGNGSNTVTLGNNAVTNTYLKGNVSIGGSVFGGNGTFSKAGYANGDHLFDNGSTDTPGVLFYYGNNTNWGIDSFYNGSNQILRFVTNLNESGGSQKAYLDTSGNFTTTGYLAPQSWKAGQVVQMKILSASDLSFSSTYTNATTNYSSIASGFYTPLSNSSYIFFEVFAHYDVNGAASDSFFSQITWNGNEAGFQHEAWANATGGGSRSSKLFPLTGRVTNSSLTGFTYSVNARRDSSDDTLTVYADAAFYVKITELAR